MYGIEIDRMNTLSISKQLQNQLRTSILNGSLIAGERLLASRSMAIDMGISRNTVIEAYEQLIAEGYLISNRGSGTYVVDIGRLIIPKKETIQYNPVKLPNKENIIAFNAGNPDAKLFPKTIWSKMLKQASMEADFHTFSFDNFAGHDKLRRVIREYVYRVKGIVCDYHQIIVTPGTSGGMDLLAKTLKYSHKKIAIEDPCITFVRNNFSNYGYELCPISVDHHGMEIEALNKVTNVDLIYVSPSHQYPIGGILPAARRIALLQYANQQNAYVIEDDYDCEFRYHGEPLQSLRNLNTERVIYFGSFSKIFSPALRVGYMIVPHHLCSEIVNQMELSNLWVNPTLQLALAEFIELKYLEKHIYKVKKVYEKKRLHLIKCIEEAFKTHAKVSGECAGLHLLFCYQRDFTNQDMKALSDAGLDVEFVEDYAIVKGKHKNELILGYGDLSFSEIEEGVRRMKKVLV